MTIGQVWRHFRMQAARKGREAARYLAMPSEHKLTEQAVRRIASPAAISRRVHQFDLRGTPERT